MKTFAISILVIVLSFGLGCAEDTAADISSGTMTLTKDTGIDFVSGTFQEKGNSYNSDSYATAGNNHSKLSSGGEMLSQPRPVNFFLGAGGFHQVFDSLAEVPDEYPDSSMTSALVKAKLGNAFVVQTASGGYAKGWISASSPTEVTIQWVRLSL